MNGSGTACSAGKQGTGIMDQRRLVLREYFIIVIVVSIVVVNVISLVVVIVVFIVAVIVVVVFVLQAGRALGLMDQRRPIVRLYFIIVVVISIVVVIVVLQASRGLVLMDQKLESKSEPGRARGSQSGSH